MSLVDEIVFSLQDGTWHELEENYVDPDSFDHEAMVRGAVSGMVSSLDDPYTVFFDPDETKSFLEDVGGEFEGVGMEIGIRDGQLQVIAPIEGTPAERAGLRPGDRIIKVDDTVTLDITIEEAVRKATSVPAERFGFTGRGVLAEGNYADMVVIDLSTIQMTGDYLTPNNPPDGIEYVFVNGKLAYKDKKHTGEKSGKVLRLN